jgi:hypothetical protein
MLAHYPEVDKMTKSTKNEPTTVIELINQINTWHKFDTKPRFERLLKTLIRSESTNSRGGI